MSGSGYDDEAEHLQAFCSLLEATNQALEHAWTDLNGWAKNLTDGGSSLHNQLAGLKTDTDGLEKDVEASGPPAASAAGDLASLMLQVLDTRIPSIEGQVGNSKDHSHQSLSQRAVTLQSEFDELHSNGFEPFEAVLTQQKSDFEDWTNEGESALGALLAGLGAAAGEVARDTQEAMTEMTDATQATGHVHTDLEEWLNADIHNLDTDLPHQIEEQCDGMPSQAIDDWAKSISGIAHQVQTQVQGLAKEASDALQKESNQATFTADTTGAALAQVNQEFGTIAAEAEAHEVEAASLAALAPKIEAAEGEIQEIRAAAEHMT